MSSIINKLIIQTIIYYVIEVVPITFIIILIYKVIYYVVSPTQSNIYDYEA